MSSQHETTTLVVSGSMGETSSTSLLGLIFSLGRCSGQRKHKSRNSLQLIVPDHPSTRHTAERHTSLDSPSSQQPTLPPPAKIRSSSPAMLADTTQTVLPKNRIAPVDAVLLPTPPHSPELAPRQVSSSSTASTSSSSSGKSKEAPPAYELRDAHYADFDRLCRIFSEKARPASMMTSVSDTAIVTKQSNESLRKSYGECGT